MGVVLSSCLLLTTVLTVAMDSPSNEAVITYEVTRKVAKEKAELLTATYGTNSVQYAIIDDERRFIRT